MADLIAPLAPTSWSLACNTASTLVLPALRQRFSVPFVGTVPAIKPACAASQTKRVSVLGTASHCRARIHPRADPRFRARLRRRAGRFEPAGDPCGRQACRPIRSIHAAIRAEIAPCFVADGPRAHRHHRARLHPLSAAARPNSSSSALGPCAGSTRRPRSRGAWSSWSARRTRASRLARRSSSRRDARFQAPCARP